MKKWPILLCVVMVLLAVSACSGKTNSPDAKEGQPAAEKQAESKDPNSENTLAQIKKAGKIVIATGGNYRPYNYMDSSNQLVGYDIDWGNEIAKELGVKAEYITGQFSGLIPGLVAKKFDILLAGVNITDERKQSIDFSDPYSEDGVVAVIKKGSGSVKSISEISGKVVGANSGSAFEAAVKNIGKYKELKPYPGPPESFADLIAGRIDAVAIGKISATDYIKNAPYGKDIEIVGEPFDTKQVGVALRKNNPELQEAINKIIADKKKDGTYDKLAMKHFGFTLNK